MGQPDKRLLWHPRQDNKFLVGGGSQITLYEWAPDFPEIRHVTSRHDLPHMKCLAWSPDPTLDDMIAVGQGTGKIDLFRLEASKYANRNNVLSTGPTVTLPVRNSRSCNSLAFCDVDSNYLAVGLDKVRGDSSLLIWDISTASSILYYNLDSDSQNLSHIQIQPSPSTRRPQPQIPRADLGPRADPRILQQHASTEFVTSVCFLPQSTHLLLAGVSTRWLRLFDLRSSAQPISVPLKVHGIATDPFDPHRIACFGDGMVTVWDARKLSLPLLSFTEHDAAADGARLHTRQNGGYVGIEFSGTRRGMLASLEKDAAHIRFWDMVGARPYLYTLDGMALEESRAREVGRSGRRSWANLPWHAGQTHAPPSPKDLSEAAFGSLVLHDTRRTKTFARTIASFAFVPNANTHQRPLTSDVMIVNKEGDLELYAMHDIPKQATWSSRGDLAISSGQTCRVLEGFPESSLLEHVDPLASHSHSRAREPEFDLRGRAHPVVNSARTASSRHRMANAPVIPPAPAPLFGRGDEEGFPALPSTSGSGARTPTYSGKEKRSSSVITADRGRWTKTESMESVMAPASVAGTVRTERASVLGGRNRRPGEGTEAGMGSRGHSTVRERRAGRGANRVVEDDISMVMKKRSLKGYGLSKPETNILIVQDDYDPLHGQVDMLADLWAWVYHSHEFLTLPTPILHGYDFSYQGLLGIWEGKIPTLHTPQQNPRQPGQPDLPQNPANGTHLDVPTYGGNHDRRLSRHVDETHPGSSGSFHAALSVLAGRRTGGIGESVRPWKPGITTSKSMQRQIALLLCGWSVREEEMMRMISRWEKDGEISRAACWLVFMKQHTKAIDLLMKSGDDAHRMMSGTVAALHACSSGGRGSTELREHCERLIVGLQDPYSRAMLTHLALNDWSEILDEEIFPFRERLAIAFQFLDDKAVTVYLHCCMERAMARGTVDGVIVPGLASRAGLEILQSYVDRTGDVQSAAVLGSYVCPPGKVGLLGAWGSGRVGRWVESYRDLLDGFQMFHCRVGFDIERGQVVLGEGVLGAEAGGWVPRQIMIRCNYCNKPVSGNGTKTGEGVEVEVGQQKERPTTCPHCNRMLPRCSICLGVLSVVGDAARDAELSHLYYKDTMDEAIVICQTCRHGGHASHILDWFYGEDGTLLHDICAVADCDCNCANEL